MAKSVTLENYDNKILGSPYLPRAAIVVWVVGAQQIASWAPLLTATFCQWVGTL